MGVALLLLHAQILAGLYGALLGSRGLMGSLHHLSAAVVDAADVALLLSISVILSSMLPPNR